MTAAVATMPASVGVDAPADRPVLRVEDPLARSDWDQLVATHPRATFFHGAAWARTLAESYGFKCCYITAVQDGRLAGLLPVIEANSWLRGKRGVSLPFTDECAPLVSDAISAKCLFEMALAEGKRRGWKYLELRDGHEHFPEFPHSVSYYTHSVPLASPIEEVFAHFDGPVRRAVRKAERSGLTVRFGNDLESVRSYYRLHCRTRTNHGAPPQPFRFFEKLHEHALRPGHGFIALALHQEHPVAGAVFLHSAREAVYKFSASDERLQEWRGPNLVIWRAIQQLVSMGIQELSFGKTSLSNAGLRRFKSGWGAIEKLISYSRYCFAPQTFARTPDLAAGVQARFVRCLPVWASRWIGQLAYGHMS